MRCKTRGLSPIQRKLTHATAKTIHKKYFPRIKSVEVLVKGFANLIQKEEIFGDTTCIDSYYRPREFLIRIDSSINEVFFLKTIIHELIHLKQFVKNELRFYDKEKNSSFGGFRLHRSMPYTLYPIDSPTEELPWEIEAHGMEDLLFDLVCKSDSSFHFLREERYNSALRPI